MTRMPMVYPASACDPKVATIRTRPIQLAMPTIDWSAPEPESRATVRITARSRPRWRLPTAIRDPALNSRLMA